MYIHMQHNVAADRNQYFMIDTQLFVICKSSNCKFVNICPNMNTICFQTYNLWYVQILGQLILNDLFPRRAKEQLNLSQGSALHQHRYQDEHLTQDALICAVTVKEFIANGLVLINVRRKEKKNWQLYDSYLTTRVVWNASQIFAA